MKAYFYFNPVQCGAMKPFGKYVDCFVSSLKFNDVKEEKKIMSRLEINATSEKTRRIC